MTHNDERRTTGGMSAGSDSASEAEAGPIQARRRVLAYLTGLVGAVIVAALGIPLAAFYVAPSLARRKPIWVTLGPLSSLRSHEPIKFTYRYSKIDGWLEKVVHGTVYAVKTDGDFFVLSNICTHLGCGVRWDRDARAFLCPCHDGLFDIAGEVISGPPPKPLPRFKHAVSDGTIRIQIEEA